MNIFVFRRRGACLIGFPDAAGMEMGRRKMQVISDGSVVVIVRLSGRIMAVVGVVGVGKIVRLSVRIRMAVMAW